MAEGVVSVCWKGHRNELATVYRSLLENGFLVDCTLSAEGKSLKAHRLILSACSPYFHSLFREESGDRPVIILLGASFETLKAVVDFMYRGQTQILRENLEAFLALARYLQIKGLLSNDNRNKNIPRSPAKDLQGPSTNKQNSCEVQRVCASHKVSPEKTSSVVTEQDRGLCVDERSIVTPSIGLPKPCENEEELMDSEITVKFEPLFPVSFSLESRNDVLDLVRSNDPVSGNGTSITEVRIDSVCGAQDLNQFSSCSGPSHGNMESSVMPHSQQQIVQLNDEGEMWSVRDVAEGDGPLFPTILVPKEEHSDDEEWGDTMDDLDVSGEDRNEADERTEPANRGLSSKTKQELMKSTCNKRLRIPPRGPQDSNVGTSESEIAETVEVPARKKQKVRTDQTKIVEAEYPNIRNCTVLVDKLVTLPLTSTQQKNHVSSHPSCPRTSNPSQNTSSSSFNSEPNSCTTSDLPTPDAHNPKASLTAQSKKDHLRHEARASSYQPDGPDKSDLVSSIGRSLEKFVEELRSVRQEIKSLNNRVKSSEETLAARSSGSSMNDLEDPNCNKVFLDRGVMISPSALHTISTTGDLNEFISALLLGVFGEAEAKLYRLFPRDASKKAFPQNFIEVAKSQYAGFLERQGHKPPYGKGVLNKVCALLARRATDLCGRRNTGSGKRKGEAETSCSTQYLVDYTTGELVTSDGKTVVLKDLPSEMPVMGSRTVGKEVATEPAIEIVTDESE